MIPAGDEPGMEGNRNLVVLILILFGVNRTLSCHLIACQVFVVGGDFVNQSSVWKDFHNPVGGGLHKLMVMAGKERNARELNQALCGTYSSVCITGALWLVLRKVFPQKKTA